MSIGAERDEDESIVHCLPDGTWCAGRYVGSISFARGRLTMRPRFGIAALRRTSRSLSSSSRQSGLAASSKRRGTGCLRFAAKFGLPVWFFAGASTCRVRSASSPQAATPLHPFDGRSRSISPAP